LRGVLLLELRGERELLLLHPCRSPLELEPAAPASLIPLSTQPRDHPSQHPRRRPPALLQPAKMVRLITQNLLSCPSRACAYPTNFPLTFRNVERLEMVDAEFNEEFVRGVLSRIEWQALRKSAAEVRAILSNAGFAFVWKVKTGPTGANAGWARGRGKAHGQGAVHSRPSARPSCRPSPRGHRPRTSSIAPETVCVRASPPLGSAAAEGGSAPQAPLFALRQCSPLELLC